MAGNLEQPRNSEDRRWTFGAAVLDERTLELRVNGAAINVERKPLEVLLFLLHHAGEVVTRDEILEAVWPGRILSETVLTKSVQKLREALLDEQQEIIKTQHGYGYRLVAPVKVEVSAASLPPRFDFKTGDHPPGRSPWKLLERLGSGGHGEVWLARHHKTGEPRVFKFALDNLALASLKREITLYRLLRDAIGDNAALVRIHDWNLELPPYFLEAEYVLEGSLVTWADRQGGAAQVPLECRLELVAQVAEAVAAAHSVGVLHKDLKPSNVLVVRSDIGLRIKLADFGSGGMLDPGRLLQIGITRLGFTRTAGAADAVSGTMMYSAPEIMAGQPATVRADIYALGVMLYQFAAGDFRKPLTTGWERDVGDELLIADIAESTEGDAARRLSDASVLARRLRTLGKRRRELAAQRDMKDRAERLANTRRELNRLRKVALAMALLAGLAVAAGTVGYRARIEAERAAATANAVTTFMNEEVLGGLRWTDAADDISFRTLLDRAAENVSARLPDQPEAAAGVHAVLGARYWDANLYVLSGQQFERAVHLYERTHGPLGDPTLLALDWLVTARRRTDRLAESVSLSRELVRRTTDKYGGASLLTLNARMNVGLGLLKVGDFSGAVGEFREQLRIAAGMPDVGAAEAQQFDHIPGMTGAPPEPIFTAMAQCALGTALVYTAEFAESERLLRNCLAAHSRIAEAHPFLGFEAKAGLLANLSYQGRFDEAEKILGDLLQPAGRQPAHERVWALGAGVLLRLEQRRPDEAMQLLQRSMELCNAETGCIFPNHHRHWDSSLAAILRQKRERRAASEAFRQLLEYREGLLGAGHPWTAPYRLALAAALLESGNVQGAAALIEGARPIVTSGFPAESPVAGQLLWMEGLLAQHRGEDARATTALRAAIEILKRRYGSQNWRVRRAQEDLGALDPPPGRSSAPAAFE